MQVLSTEISPSTVCRTLKRYGLTRKKIHQVAMQRSSEPRGGFMAQCFLLKRRMLVMKLAQILVTMLEDMANPNLSWIYFFSVYTVYS